MCGIIGAFNFKPKNTKNKEKLEDVNKWVIDQLENQISRGKEGFGIMFIDQKNNIKLERSTELVKTMLDLYLTKSKMIILHHRMPSSTTNKLDQTHPILVDNGSLKYKYYIIHNGCIHNAEELKKEHEKLGFTYTTKIETKYTNEKDFNDSESFAIELARYIENQTKIIDTTGSLAFIAIQVNKKTGKATKTFYGKNDMNPLKMSGTRGKIRLSSEGEGTSVKENILYEFDLKNFQSKKRKLTIKEKEHTWANSNDPYREYNKTLNDKTLEDKELLADTTIDETLNELIEEETEKAIDEITLFVAEFFDKLKEETTLYGIDMKKEKQEITKKIITLMHECHNNCQEIHTNAIIEDVQQIPFD